MLASRARGQGDTLLRGSPCVKSNHLVMSGGGLTMNDVPSDPAPEATRDAKSAKRRIWFPIAALFLSLLAIIAVQYYDTDTGGRRLLSFIASMVGLLAVVVWFFFMAGIPGRVRLAVAGLVAVGIVAFVASVRRVEFSGDMEPTFDFRWTADRTALLEEHRARQDKQAETVKTANLTSLEIGPYDVLQYRGPERDGVSQGPKLARDWSKNAPQVLWRQPVGGGYASFVVVGPALVTIEQRRDEEAIVAYDAETGRELWVYKYPARFSEPLGGVGPRATPEFHADRIYALGATGVLSCLDMADGKRQWSFNILNENECENLDWGMSGSPLVYDDVVLVNPGNQKGDKASRSIVAYDLADGKRRFAGGESKAGYASPMLVTLDGQQQLLIFDGVGLAGFDPEDASQLWRFPWKSEFDINAAQPFVVDENRVVITSATGTALLNIEQVDGEWKVEPVWTSRRLKGGYCSPIVHDGYVYGIDESILVCLDLEDGKLQWKDRDGQFGHGQILARDDLILVLGEAGELALVEATPEKYHELGRIQAIEGKTWNVPVLVGDRIYVRNHLEMAAYVLPTVDAPETDTDTQPADADAETSTPDSE
ncbi:MAG: hypothetical protein DWQ37_20420 [Planctomycetota bacterium]|nr:MAG: hypothetical protein DWQ37_20420 [Planctomycetota bacterium]